MGLTYEQIDYEKEQTRTLMLSLLETARLTTDFSPDTRVFIEVFPANEGGCTIYFSDLGTGEPKRWRVRRRSVSPAVYQFDDINNLIDCAVKLFRLYSHRIRKSSLYRVETGWRLALYPLDILENVTLPFVDEYAPRCGEGELAAVWLEEHGTCILADNAVDVLSSYFG